MEETLLFNKKKMDLTPKPITRKIQIGDIGDISNRKSTFSYTAKLPRTARNTATLEFLGVNGNNSRKPFENIVVDYFVDGVPLIVNGYVVIKRTSEFYEVNLFNGIIDLVERLKGKKIVDLQLNDLDHFISAQNYIDSFSNTAGYIYGLANFGLGTSAAVKVERQAPCIFVHTLFRKILEGSGINLVGDFFLQNEDYLSEVITPSRGYEISDSVFTQTAKGSVDTSTVSGYKSSNTYINETKIFNVTGVGLVGSSASGTKTTFSVAGTYKFVLDISYNSYKTGLSFLFVVNGSAKASVYFQEGSSPRTAEVVVGLQIGDEVEFKLNIFSNIPDYSDEFEQDFARFEVSYSVSADVDIFLQEGGQIVTPSEYLGDLNQIDFVKDVINRYALVLHPISDSSDYRFRRLENVLNDRYEAEDWTSKLVDGVKSEDYVSGYAQNNYFKYNYPEEIVIPNNDGSIVIENENITSEKTIYNSPFQVPRSKGSLFSEPQYIIPIWETVEAVVENKETPIKVMRLKRVSGAVNAKLFDEITGVSSSGLVPVLSMQNMSMAYFLANYYKGFRNLINDFKEVEFMLNVSLIDVFNLDFFKLKYFKQTGRFYYLQSIQHTPGKISKAKLLELSTFSVNQPPSAVGNFTFEMGNSSTRTITLSNILNGYVDEELDPALKIKISDGFNADAVIYQNGVAITSEIEILASEWAVKVTDILGSLAERSYSWTFDVADEGSGSYSGITGQIAATVKELVNVAPNANAGSDSAVTLEVNYPYPFRGVSLIGSASNDSTGEIVSWLWEVQSKPASSEAYISSNTTSPNEVLIIPNEFESAGNYVMLLTVTDEFGATDTDTVEVFVNLDFKELD